MMKLVYRLGQVTRVLKLILYSRCLFCALVLIIPVMAYHVLWTPGDKPVGSTRIEIALAKFITSRWVGCWTQEALHTNTNDIWNWIFLSASETVKWIQGFQYALINFSRFDLI